jgi:hypothetical protein
MAAQKIDKNQSTQITVMLAFLYSALFYSFLFCCILYELC